MTTEQKIIGGIGLATLLIIVGGAFVFTKDPSSSIPADQLLSKISIHWHPQVNVFIKGKTQEIPTKIGIGAVMGKFHTHTSDGVIHMEMSGPVSKDDATVGNFFRAWGKEFSSTKILDKTNGPEGKVKMLVNGKENKEFENYTMNDNDKIEIRYE